MLRGRIKTVEKEPRLGVHDGGCDDEKQVRLKPKAGGEQGNLGWKMGTPVGTGSACRGDGLQDRGVSDGWHGEEKLLAGPNVGQGEGERGRKGGEVKKPERGDAGNFLHLALFYTVDRLPSLCLSSQCPRVSENWVEPCEGG